MSRIFTVPPEYIDEIEAVVARGVDACKRDEFFRSDGQKSVRLVPDFMLKDGATVEVMVVVATVDDMPKLMDAMRRVASEAPNDEPVKVDREPGEPLVWVRHGPELGNRIAVIVTSDGIVDASPDATRSQLHDALALLAKITVTERAAVVARARTRQALHV
jgi:hypothetical protein